MTRLHPLTDAAQTPLQYSSALTPQPAVYKQEHEGEWISKARSEAQVSCYAHSAQLLQRKNHTKNAAFLCQLIPVMSLLGLEHSRYHQPALVSIARGPFSATQQNDASMKTWQRNVAHDTRGPRSCPFPWGCGSPAHHLLLSHNVKRPTSHADPQANSPFQLRLECRIVMCHNSCCKSPSTSHSLTYYAISPQRCNHIRYLWEYKVIKKGWELQTVGLTYE